MIPEDEVLDDRRYMQMNSQQQLRLIEQYCGGIGEKIRTAASKEEARRLADEACGAFERECPSDLVRRSLVHRVRQMVDEHWDGQP